jgi:hypothetical protein
MTLSTSRSLFALALCWFLIPVADAQGAPPSPAPIPSPPALPQGTTREQMWPAATEEGWKKPCLIRRR